MRRSDVLNEIRKRMGEENLTQSCSGRGCQVDMTNVANERVIVDVDLAFKRRGGTGKRCDRILFYMDITQNNLVIVLIELKSGTFKATDVAEQLQSSADFVSALIPRALETICIPVVFHGKGIHSAQWAKFRSSSVRFRSKEYIIRRNKCGTPRNLANVLPKLDR